MHAYLPPQRREPGNPRLQVGVHLVHALVVRRGGRKPITRGLREALSYSCWPAKRAKKCSRSRKVSEKTPWSHASVTLKWRVAVQ